MSINLIFTDFIVANCILIFTFLIFIENDIFTLLIRSVKCKFSGNDNLFYHFVFLVERVVSEYTSVLFQWYP